MHSLHFFNLASGGLLILMSVSSSFNLASGGFLAALPLSLHPLPSQTSSCSNLPFETRGRSWMLESASYKKQGTQKGFCAKEPHRVLLDFSA